VTSAKATDDRQNKPAKIIMEVIFLFIRIIIQLYVEHVQHKGCG
jgi:hypothetical protein